MQKLNSTPISRINAINSVPNDMPFEFIDELKKWDKIIKSPYGATYYNAPVGWDYKEHNSLRISNHWNFASKGTLHCQTTNEVSNNSHWSIGKFDSKLNKYTIIKSEPINTKRIKKDIRYKLLVLEIKRDIAIVRMNENSTDSSKNVISNRLSTLELRFLCSKYKVLSKV
jgi:hypothetical protein